MRGRGLLVLALIVVALAAFIALYEHKLPSSDERQKDAKQLFNLKTDEVEGLTIARPGEPAVEISRAPAAAESASARGDETPGSTDAASRHWRMTKPWSFPADGSAVDGLVDALTGLQQQRELTDFKAADLGLDKPRAQVTLRTESGERTLTVGAKVPGLSSMAVRVDGDAHAFVVGAGLWSQLDKKPGDWRSRDVVPGSRSDIKGVSWTNSGGAVTLERSTVGFRVTQPYEDVADADRVDALMTALTGLRIDHFVDSSAGDDVANDSESTPSTHLSVTLADRPQPFDVELSSAKPGAVTVEYAGQRGTCKSDLLDKLGSDAEGWRSKAWTSLHVYDLQKVVVRDSEGTVELARTDSGWSRNGKQIPFDAATDLLDAVTGAKAQHVHPLTASESKPGGKPAVTITLTPQSGDTAQTLSLFSDGVALNSSRSVRLDMPDDLLARLTSRLRDVRSAKATEAAETDGKAKTAEGRRPDGSPD